jgi:hypothetical protein
MSPIHYVPVEDSDTEVVEEVTYRQRTTRGMKIKQQQVPMDNPHQETTGKASRSRRKIQSQVQLCEVDETQQELDSPGEHLQSRSKNRRHAKLRQVEEPHLEPDNTDYLNTYEVIGEQRDDFPDPGQGGMQPQVMVQLCISHIILLLIWPARPLSTNGSSIGAHISIFYYRWRDGHMLRSAPCALPDMRI